MASDEEYALLFQFEDAMKVRVAMPVRSMYKDFMILSTHGGERQYIFFPENSEIKEEYPLISRSDAFAISTNQAKRQINQEIRERELGERSI